MTFFDRHRDRLGPLGSRRSRLPSGAACNPLVVPYFDGILRQSTAD